MKLPPEGPSARFYGNGKIFALGCVLLATTFLSRDGHSKVSEAYQPSFPWLVEVSSTYRDELSGRAQRVRGVGFLARIRNSYFVISDSHLTQGETVGIRLAGQVKGIPQAKKYEEGKVNWLANNEIDVEVIEIPEPVPAIRPVFVYDLNSGKFGLEEGDPIQFASRDDVVELGREVWAPIPEGLRKRPVPYIGVPIEQVLGRTDIDPAREAYGITFNWMLADQVLDSRVVEGMSGAPLLYFDPLSGKITVGGLAKSVHRYFDRSYFSYGAQLSEVLIQYAFERKRGHLTPARWKYREKVGTYLEYGDGSVEINPSLIPTGGGESSDVGEMGVAAGDFLFSELGVQVGMTYRGKRALGFRVRNFPEFRFQSLFADRIAQKYLESLSAMKGRFEVIQDESRLLELFRERIQVADRASGKTDDSDPIAGECRVDEGALSDGRIQVHLRSPRGESVTLEISQERFEPFVRMPLRNGEAGAPRKVLVDVKGLFFADLRMIEQPTMGLRGDRVLPHLDLQRTSSYLRLCGKSPCVVVRWPESEHDRPVACRRSNPNSLSR